MIVSDAPSNGPYGGWAGAYWESGWSSVLPLPPARKSPPPDGYTGRSGIVPSYPDVYSWMESNSHGNIALRMPADVIGLDVDDYGSKGGGATLASCVASWGELPATWRSTARDDGVSGIRFYRIPEGLRWPGELPGGGVEVIQATHRYAVAPPSVHPDTGTAYRWYSPSGQVSLSLPAPSELPELPSAWVSGLTGGELDTGEAKTGIEVTEAISWLRSLDRFGAAPCHAMQVAMSREVVGSRHEHTMGLVLYMVRLAATGHYGGETALSGERASFLADVSSAGRGRTMSEAEAEWNRLLSGAVDIVRNDPQENDCDCYNELTSAVVVEGSLKAPAGPESLSDGLGGSSEGEGPEGDPDRYAGMMSGWDWLTSAAQPVEPIWGQGDDVLAAEGESLVIAGPQGTGKTTLGQQFTLGRVGIPGFETLLGYPIQPCTTGRVLYLAMDRPRQAARSIRRMVDEGSSELLNDRLVIWPGPPLADLAKDPHELLRMTRAVGAGQVIVDSLKDAAVGLTDDEVGAGWNRARQLLIQAGIEIVELHHVRKVTTGEKGRKPALDDLYGSTWITSGTGSVILLSGEAGDPLVKLHHLKQPVNEVGPMDVLHDQTTGRSTAQGQVDLLALANASADGITALDAARAMFDSSTPTMGQKEKARRRLRRLVQGGQLVEIEGTRSEPARYWPGSPVQMPPRDQTVNLLVGGGARGGAREKFYGGVHEGCTGCTEGVEDPRNSGDLEVHGEVHGVHAPRGARLPPPLERGAAPPQPSEGEEEAERKTIETCSIPACETSAATRGLCVRHLREDLGVTMAPGIDSNTTEGTKEWAAEGDMS